MLIVNKTDSHLSSRSLPFPGQTDEKQQSKHMIMDHDERHEDSGVGGGVTGVTCFGEEEQG